MLEDTIYFGTAELALVDHTHTHTHVRRLESYFFPLFYWGLVEGIDNKKNYGNPIHNWALLQGKI